MPEDFGAAARPDRGGTPPADDDGAQESLPNPYAVGSEPPPRQPERQPDGPPPGPGPHRPAGEDRRDSRGPGRRGSPSGDSDKALRRRVRLAALLAAVAAVTAVTLPPVGVALGIGLLVVGFRIRRDPRAREIGVAATWIPYVGGVLAIVVGLVMTALALFLSRELADLRECLAGANTRVAEANCQDEFRQQVEERLPGVG